MSGWERDSHDIQKCVTPHGVVYLHPRPAYCDRGRFIAYVDPRHGPACSPCDIDDQDGFPRYYFDEERAKAELGAWMDARGWSP